jgi:hypothetical protein
VVLLLIYKEKVHMRKKIVQRQPREHLHLIEIIPCPDLVDRLVM